jgi:negative regulator of flagellin synthesis FlgM
MEIPSNEFRIKNRNVQETRDVASKRANVQKSESAPTRSTGGEQIALSSKAKDIQRAHEAIKSAPDIRAEKVNRIKAEVAQGKFRVDSEVLAERILKEIITESSFLD